MTLQFGVFDHIEPVPEQPPNQIYRERLTRIERFDTAGFLPITRPSTTHRRCIAWRRRKMCFWPV